MESKLRTLGELVGMILGAIAILALMIWLPLKIFGWFVSSMSHTTQTKKTETNQVIERENTRQTTTDSGLTPSLPNPEGESGAETSEPSSSGALNSSGSSGSTCYHWHSSGYCLDSLEEEAYSAGYWDASYGADYGRGYMVDDTCDSECDDALEDAYWEGYYDWH